MLYERLGDSLARLVEPMLRRPAHVQAAALCIRQKGNRREVLLVTSRGTGRWILPKGWPMKGKTLAQAAAQEAWEEAGVRGEIEPEPIGSYSARKVVESGLGLRCMVHVFRLSVDRLEDDFPESRQRRRKWVSTSRAAKMVQEAELKALLLSL
jgi:8-oxo-dGTP pyrophosphatase MutT (NUDIX family)